jgi:hypothetical protein
MVGTVVTAMPLRLDYIYTSGCDNLGALDSFEFLMHEFVYVYLITFLRWARRGPWLLHSWTSFTIQINSEL